MLSFNIQYIYFTLEAASRTPEVDSASNICLTQDTAANKRGGGGGGGGEGTGLWYHGT